MRVLLKNLGDATRVVYDVHQHPVSIDVGKSAEADLHDNLIENLRAAQGQGDGLHVSRAGERVRVRPKGSPGEVTPTSVLAQAPDLDYHTLLALTHKAVPDMDLGPRPTKEAMLVALRDAVPKG